MIPTNPARTSGMTDSIYEALIESGYSPRSYSGRGMYGKKCVALSVKDETALLKVGAALGDLAETRACTDGLGRGLIVYWPSQAWLPEYVSDEDDG